MVGGSYGESLALPAVASGSDQSVGVERQAVSGDGIAPAAASAAPPEGAHCECEPTELESSHRLARASEPTLERRTPDTGPCALQAGGLRVGGEERGVGRTPSDAPLRLAPRTTRAQRACVQHYPGLAARPGTAALAARSRALATTANLAQDPCSDL